MRCHRGTVLAVTPVVLVPWRADNGQRSDIWAYTRKQIWGLRHPGWPIVEGVAPDGPFNRSAAINAAAETAGDWDVAVIADSDTFTERRSLLRAVDAAVRYPTRLLLARRVFAPTGAAATTYLFSTRHRPLSQWWATTRRRQRQQ